VRRLLVILALGSTASIAAAAPPQIASEITLPPNGDNQRAEVSQWIGLV
jgi:hypothetical protein